MISNNVQPATIVILGALGDLSRRKLIPALYHLSIKGMFGPEHLILGVDIARGANGESFTALVKEILQGIKPVEGEKNLSEWCDCSLAYHSLIAGNRHDYSGLAAKISELEKAHNLPGNRVFYLAIPIDALEGALTGLGEAVLNQSPGWTRLVLEKPFGTDLLSHRKLDSLAHKYFKEEQIFRIDHYLGKETVQNLFAFRFANTIFEQVWNRQNIASVQITVAEDVGVEGRSPYYERTGALRDMVQNHLTQLLTLVAMGVPSSFEPGAIRYEKAKVLREITPVEAGSVIFGQYESGEINGKRVAGYREETGVSPSSETETFVALKMEVANWRWKGVPFYLRTGKRMSRRRTRIVIGFQCVPLSIFHPLQKDCQVHPNVLVATLQPDEGFDLYVQVKALGEPFRLTTQRFSFRYADVFGPIGDAYETLILDILKGNLSLFVSDEEVDYAWRLYDDLLKQKIPVYRYKAGTDGPAELNRLGMGTELVD